MAPGKLCVSETFDPIAMSRKYPFAMPWELVSKIVLCVKYIPSAVLALEY